MPKVIGVSVGADGAVWCADSAGNVYMRVGNEWKRNPTAIANEVAVGNINHIYCRNPQGYVFRLKGTTYDAQWDKDSVASLVTKSISAGADGVVWVVNAKSELVMLDNGVWRHNPHKKDAVAVTVGDAGEVWYCNTAGKIFRLNGSAYDSQWVEEPVASQVKSLSAGHDGTLWVTNQKDEIWKKTSAAPVNYQKNDKGKAAQISVGSTQLVWCVNAAGEIFHAQGTNYDTYWVKVAPPVMPARTYEVKQGEWLLKIVREQFKPISEADALKKADEIAKLNGWPNREHVLHAGDVIILA